MKKNDRNSDSTTSASASSSRKKTTAGSTKKQINSSNGNRGTATSGGIRSKKKDVGRAPINDDEAIGCKKRSRGKKSSKILPADVQKEVSPSDGLIGEASPQVVSSGSELLVQHEGVKYDIATINAKIAAVPLSEHEIARRNAIGQFGHSLVQCPCESALNKSLPQWDAGWLIVQGARKHNLKSITVPFPLSAFTVVTGVSGSGKSSLVQDVLYSTVTRELTHSSVPNRTCDGVLGCDQLESVVYVDQSPIGQTATSNPATYTGLFDLIRNLFAQLPESKLKGFSPRQFSFNVPGGRCEKCEGAGVIKVEMHFLADVWIVCDACGGLRYNSETLKVKYRGKSINDVLETTCGEALEFFKQSRSISRILRILCDVGLDYLPLGQSATTLSGGEAQRIKLAAELSRTDSGHTLYVLDEPTTGLHFEDVRKLLDVLHSLVDLGNTVVVVEHNLDVVKNADWIIEIGPEAGLEGGRLVFTGTPEQLLEYTAKRYSSPELQRSMLRSYTGEVLFPLFENGTFYERQSFSVASYKEGVKETTGPDSDERIALPESDSLDVPWEVDGRRWHTELRSTETGASCRWDARILTTIVDRLVDSFDSLSDNWTLRTKVEVISESDDRTWFMRAITSDEWLLNLHFRTRKSFFSRDVLTRNLALKPLSDMDEIPLFGTQPRVRVENVGVWQEIEIRVFSFAEIDRSEFWNFLDLAAKNFIEQINSIGKDESNVIPWKTGGCEWHFSQQGFYGSLTEPRWSFKLLKNIIDVVQGVNPKITVDWRQKICVLLDAEKTSVGWVRVFTKNVDHICVQIAVVKGSIESTSCEGLGFEPVFDINESKADFFYIRYRSEEDFDEESLRKFLKETFKHRIKE